MNGTSVFRDYLIVLPSNLRLISLKSLTVSSESCSQYSALPGEISS